MRDYGAILGEFRQFGPYDRDNPQIPDGWRLADGTQYPGGLDRSDEFIPVEGSENQFASVVIEFIGYD